MAVGIGLIRVYTTVDLDKYPLSLSFVRVKAPKKDNQSSSISVRKRHRTTVSCLLATMHAYCSIVASRNFGSVPGALELQVPIY